MKHDHQRIGAIRVVVGRRVDRISLANRRDRRVVTTARDATLCGLVRVASLARDGEEALHAATPLDALRLEGALNTLRNIEHVIEAVEHTGTQRACASQRSDFRTQHGDIGLRFHARGEHHGTHGEKCQNEALGSLHARGVAQAEAMHGESDHVHFDGVDRLHTQRVLQVRSAIGFCANPRFRVQARDFVRIVQLENVTLAMLADGHEGFASGRPTAARLVLDTVEDVWPETSGGLSTRLLDVFRVAEARVSALPASVNDDALDEGTSVASLLLVASLGTSACAAWVGADVAVHVRGTRITKTRPHTLFEECRDKDVDIPEGLDGSTNSIVTRRIGGNLEDKAPSFAAFTVNAGDALVLLRRDTFDGALIVKEAAAHADPATLSARLAEHAFKERSVFSAVAVLRFEESGSAYR